MDTPGDKALLSDLGHDELTLLLSLGEQLVAELDSRQRPGAGGETACRVVQAETLVVPMIDPDSRPFTYRAASGEYAAMNSRPDLPDP